MCYRYLRRSFEPNAEVVDYTGPGLIVLIRILTSETERLAFW